MSKHEPHTKHEVDTIEQLTQVAKLLSDKRKGGKINA